MIIKTRILSMNLFEWKSILNKIKINNRIKIFLNINIIQNRSLIFNRRIKIMKSTSTRASMKLLSSLSKTEIQMRKS